MDKKILINLKKKVLNILNDEAMEKFNNILDTNNSLFMSTKEVGIPIELSVTKFEQIKKPYSKYLYEKLLPYISSFNEIAIEFINDNSKLASTKWKLEEHLICNVCRKEIKIEDKDKKYSGCYQKILCNCEKPTTNGDYSSIFYNKFFSFILNWSYLYRYWFEKLTKIRETLNDVSSNSNLDDKARNIIRSYIFQELRILLCDSYSYIDTCKASIYFLSDIKVFSELSVNDTYYKKAKSKIKEIQEDKSKYLDTLKSSCRLLRQDTKTVEYLFNKYKLPFIKEDNKTMKDYNWYWIKSTRNLIQHNQSAISININELDNYFNDVNLFLACITCILFSHCLTLFMCLSLFIDDKIYLP